MFDTYLKRDDKRNNARSHQKRDWIVDGFTLLGWVLKFLCVTPYQGLFHRLKQNPNHLLYIFTLHVLAAPLYLFYLDESVVRFYILHYGERILPEILLYVRLPIFLYLVSHLYLLLWRLPSLRRESTSNRKLNQLGLVPSYKAEKIKYLKEYALDDDQTRLVVTNPSVGKTKFKEKTEVIEEAFDFKICDIDYGKNKGIIHIDYRQKEFPKRILFDEFYADFTPKPYQFGIGTALTGQKVYTTLEEMVHLLVAGETGSGKSSFLRQALFQLLRQKYPLKIHFVDLKRGIEASTFKNDPRVDVITEVSQVISVLSKLLKIYEKRTDLFESSGTLKISKYEQKEKTRLTRHLLIIDECAEIFIPSSHDKAEKQRLELASNKIGRLTRLARSAGIHIMLCTQRPSREAINMQSKDNMVSRLCFRVNNGYVSAMVLDNEKAAKINKDAKGRGIWKASDGELEIQVPLIEEDETRDRLKNIEIAPFNLKEEASDEKAPVDDITKDPDA